MAENTPTEIDDTLVTTRGDSCHAVVGSNSLNPKKHTGDALKGIGYRFNTLLEAIGQAILGKPDVVHINHPMLSDIVAFIGKGGWNVLDTETDVRSAALETLCHSDIRLKTMLGRGEVSIKGEDRLARAKEAGHIRLGVGVFFTFWNNKQFIPECWKGTDYYIYFDGTVIISPIGERYVFCLYWDRDTWCATLDWLGRDDCKDSVSAVITA